jgi:acyl-CoA hydrolase
VVPSHFEPHPPMSGDPTQAVRTVEETAIEMAQLVLPHEANVHGTVLGGTVMHWIDLAAAVVATRHARRPVVTAAIDEMSFVAPIQVGQLALIRACMTLVDRSSMEIRVDVEAEDMIRNQRRHTSTAFVTFVALDGETGKPTPVPPLKLESDVERAEHARAVERRRLRLERRASHLKPDGR